MSRRMCLLVFCVLSLSVAQCARRSAVGDAKAVVVRGSESMRWLMTRLAERYIARHPGRDVEVHAAGTGPGMSALAEGRADVAGATRRMTAREREQAERAHIRITETAVAAEAVVVFVHPSNPVDSLTVDQIRAIFTGQASSWNDFGGPRERIVVLDRQDSDGTYDIHDTFKAVALGRRPLSPHAERRQHAYQMLNGVGVNPFAIGYARPDQVDRKLVRVVKVRTESGKAVDYSEQAVVRGDYPLARRVYFYSVPDERGRVGEFLAWCRSDEAMRIMRKNGLIVLQ